MVVRLVSGAKQQGHNAFFAFDCLEVVERC